VTSQPTGALGGALRVGPIEPGDHTAVEEAARESGISIDVGAEVLRDWARLAVARDTAEGAIAGFCLAWRAADELQLIELATLPRYRRRGVARALLSELVEHGRCHGARLVLLEVRRSNGAAIALYESAGFRATGVRRRYYASNGEDALIMMLGLDPSTQRWLTQPGSGEAP
jgi:ribosomal-protein-alanine N-acetyltransferase